MTAIDKQNEFVCISYGSGYVELFMTLEQVESIATIGENDLAVEEVSKDPIIKKQFEQYSDETIEKAFKDIGIEEQGRTFTREEDEEFYKEFSAELDELNNLLERNGHNIFYTDDSRRYLCEDGDYTFGLYGKLNFYKAGKTVKYYLRPVKKVSLRIKD